MGNTKKLKNINNKNKKIIMYNVYNNFLIIINSFWQFENI